MRIMGFVLCVMEPKTNKIQSFDMSRHKGTHEGNRSLLVLSTGSGQAGNLAFCFLKQPKTKTGRCKT